MDHPKSGTEDGETPTAKQPKKFERLAESVFMIGVAGASIAFGFGTTIAAAKKKDPEYFNKGMTLSGPRIEPAGSLALRALGWGTVYAVAGCSVLFYGIWKLLDVKDLQEFRMKVGGLLPVIPKNHPPQGRTEFENLTDLLQYVIDEDNKLKSQKIANEPASHTTKSHEEA